MVMKEGLRSFEILTLSKSDLSWNPCSSLFLPTASIRLWAKLILTGFDDYLWHQRQLLNSHQGLVNRELWSQMYQAFHQAGSSRSQMEVSTFVVAQLLAQKLPLRLLVCSDLRWTSKVRNLRRPSLPIWIGSLHCSRLQKEVWLLY
jgi:hypothetical protein